MKTAIDSLKEYLKERSPGGIALAFSGGVDSSLLLALLKQLRESAPFPLLALTMHSVFQKEEELDDVKRAASQMGVELHVFDSNPLKVPEVKHNHPDRCYHCKHAIFSEIVKFASKKGIRTVMDGTNADDRNVYRPGRRALRELGVVSPLMELGITKKEIREMASALGLQCASKPAAPCLATRFEYGTELTPEAIRSVAEGENVLRRLLPDATDIRLRVHAKIARIEVRESFLPEVAAQHATIVKELKALGFQYITLDLEGFRSGSMDLDLPKN